MKTNRPITVIELRNYLLTPNSRERFSRYFAEHFVDSQNALGGFVLGQFAVKGGGNNFFWVRGFENMRTRSRFLPKFYGGPVWREFGAEANEMMLDSDNVYLLKPLDESQIFRKNKVLQIDFYFAKRGTLGELISLFQTEYVPILENAEIGETTLWSSELSENDFPRLPAFQYENLLTAVTSFADESDYQFKLKEINLTNVELKRRLEELVSKKDGLTLYET